ncbi:hypothetical protein TVAG_341400 [Trichomonas vaginalis G3]|uniref:Uncharacterized protein n=1 Tax=Trichomonas vaginalis (strain ATCC PRA-98 / G3) TaxID=412133 RepID=A2DTU9_TRIV3|nr:hypothetical protein TVAGG3_1036680 [Trichomonas vaginalis G3]EAY16246.1 hypothetical protein TVAG_341400 [Trichomonas vaginalis G3]KAI5493249.1 hypothetical protein TVAGG3_1036680 [Trichomonas vaginalis G3]|eukprot:XP_001328469.1 hypothetical protein [Trichomonas vaginalis G3]
MDHHCNCHEFCHDPSNGSIEGLMQNQCIDPDLDPIEEMLSQISVDINSTAKHPLEILLEKNIKCTKHLTSALENMTQILSETSPEINFLPYADQSYTESEALRAQIEAHIDFNSKFEENISPPHSGYF